MHPLGLQFFLYDYDLCRCITSSPCSSKLGAQVVIDVEEGDGAHLDAHARGRFFRRQGVIEGRVENEAGSAVVLVVHLEDEALVAGLLGKEAPAVRIAVSQRVVLSSALREFELIEEVVRFRHRRSVAHR